MREGGKSHAGRSQRLELPNSTVRRCYHRHLWVVLGSLVCFLPYIVRIPMLALEEVAEPTLLAENGH